MAVAVQVCYLIESEISFFAGGPNQSCAAEMNVICYSPKGSSKVDRRRTNRGLKGNSGGKPGRSGRKEWAPSLRAGPTGSVSPRLDFLVAWAAARSTVRKLVRCGVPLEIVCRHLAPPIASTATLRKHFNKEVEEGMLQANLRVAAVAFAMATSGRHEGMTRWWIERRVPNGQPNRR